jgi:hypothetical protein
MSVLDELHRAQLVAVDHVDVALDIAFGVLHDAMRELRFSEVDAALRAFDFRTANIDLSVTILMATKWPPGRLAARDDVVSEFLTRIEEQEPERLVGLRSALTAPPPRSATESR